MMDDDDDDELDLDPIDRAALEAAMETASVDPARDEQLRWKLADGQSWFDVSAFAAGCMQAENLRLKPWRSPPADGDEDDPSPRDRDAASLLKALLAAGLSRFEPDPLAALAAKRRRRRKGSGK